MAFMFSREPNEDCVHFLVSLLLMFGIVLLGASQSNNGDDTQSHQEGHDIDFDDTNDQGGGEHNQEKERITAIDTRMILFLLTCSSAICGIIANSWKNRETLFLYRKAVMMSWIATADTMMALLSRIDKDVAQVTFLFGFVFCVALGGLVFYSGVCLTDHCCSPSMRTTTPTTNAIEPFIEGTSTAQRSSSTSFSSVASWTEVKVALSFFVAMIPSIILADEVGGVAYPSLGWPIWLYFTVVAFGGFLGAALLVFCNLRQNCGCEEAADEETNNNSGSRWETSTSNIVAWPVACVGATASMGMYLRCTKWHADGLELFIGLFGAFACGMPVFLLGESFLPRRDGTEISLLEH